MTPEGPKRLAWRKGTAERAAILVSDLPLLKELLADSTRARFPVLSRAEDTMKYTIVHVRDPLPFVMACLERGASCTSAVQCLLAAGKWAAADSFVRALFELCPRSAGLSWGGPICSTKLRGTAGPPSPAQEALIECARRGLPATCSPCDAAPTLWEEIYRYSFTQGGSESAMDIAKEAAENFQGHKEMVALSAEHCRAGRKEKVLRCLGALARALAGEKLGS